MVAQRLEHQASGRSAEQGIDHFAYQVFLGSFLADGSLIDMRLIGIVPLNQPFFKHDLHQLERGCVTDILCLQQFFMHFPHTCLVPFPEHLQDLEFAFRGFFRFRSRHDGQN